MQILDDQLMHHIANLPPDEAGEWLILVPHDEFIGAWNVESLDPSFFFDFEDLIGEYRTLFPSGLEAFKRRCDEFSYRIAWAIDPADTLRAYESLHTPPPFSIRSGLEGTVNGFLPWQIEGYNKLIAPDGLRGGLCFWDTGMGKSVFVAMAIMHHMKAHDVDTALVVVKSNNKTDMKRKLKKLADIDSVILDGYKPIKRIEKYVELDKLDRRVIIMNYEKFREDQPFMEALVTGRRVLVLWDEMPTKLKNRGTLLYNSVRDVLYERVPNKDEPYNKEIRWNLKRPAWLRQYELTATPIERDPGDQFSCVRLIDPNVLGTASKFEKEHVLLRDPFSKKPKKWTRVDRIGHKLNHMMHRVDKTDPKVAPYFPKLIEEPVYIDWNDKHRRIYDTLASKAALELEEGEDVSILALINALQMICDAPSMINMSAFKREEFENLLMEASEDEEIVRQGSEIAMKLMQQLGELSDEGHPKLQRLKEDLTERYPDDKVIFFSTWAEYLHPIITEHLDGWGVTYEVYAGTDRQRQTAKDRWRSDPECRVLVSSDAGSDSVDLPEASLVINYNLPWLFSRLRQRINRASRADSGHARLRVLNYLMADSVEERRMTLIEIRRGYHEEFTSLSVKESQSARYTMDDLLFALLGSDSGVILDGGSELDLQEQHF
jgi:SNF2 family DNA or RNA helicase